CLSLRRIFSLYTASTAYYSFSLHDALPICWFFILPPLAGLVVQPGIGSLSDRTWIPKIGRRLPYLLVGMIFAVITMILLPNVGRFGLGYGSIEALIFGAVAIVILDVWQCNHLK